MKITGRRWLVPLLSLALTWPALLIAGDYGNFDTEEARTSTPEPRQDIDSSALKEKTPATRSAEAPQPATSDSRGSVARSAFTTGIDQREPVEELDQVAPDSNEVTFFTELENMAGQTAVHRWEYQGDVHAEVEFKVGGSRWRVWSRKALLPEWQGEWTVSVLNREGELLHQDSVVYAQSGIKTEQVSRE